MKKILKKSANAAIEKKQSDENYYITFKNDLNFSAKEFVKAVLSLGDGIGELHKRLKSGAEKLYKKNAGKILGNPYASLIAWDSIIESVGDRDIDGYGRSDKNTMWNVIYKGWYDGYQPDDEKEFRRWFIASLALARAMKVSIC